MQPRKISKPKDMPAYPGGQSYTVSIYKDGNRIIQILDEEKYAREQLKKKKK